MTMANITGGTLLLPGAGEAAPGTVQIKGANIAAIDAPSPAENDIDASGLLVAPGIIDLGVFTTDKPAFKYGGITRAALMPDQTPVHDDPATIRFAGLQGKPDHWVHPLAAATQKLAGDSIAEIALMKEAGALGVATGRRWIADSGLMLRLMRYCAMLDLPVIVHCEDGGLTNGAVATDGETATRLGLPSAPALAESLAVSRDIALAKHSGARVHFRQVTTADALDLVRGAKSAGLPITCGITPAHLLLCDDALSDYRTFARFTPPLRGAPDRQACIAAIADGTIDVISSGHAPQGPEAKRLPFAEAATGMAGAESLLALSLNFVRDGTITMGRLFDLIARNPARILGVNAGQITAGMEADLILIDTEAPWQIDSAKMAALAGNTPFDKLPVQGRVRKMIKGGKIIS